MRIIARELAEGPLSSLAPVLRCRPEDVFYCSNMRFWDGFYDPDCLYIGKSSALSPQPPVVEGRYQIQLLLIEDQPIPQRWLDDPAARIISFPAETDPFQLFNAISDSGFCLPRYAMKLTELLDSIPNDDFSAIARHVSNILGRPVALLTPRLQLLAFSAETDESAERLFTRLRSYRLNGYLSPGMLALDSYQVYPLKDYPGASGALLTPIVHEGELKDVLGYIYCPEIPKAVAVANLPALRYISRLLTNRFLRFIREDRGEDAAFSLLMGKIISGELRDDALIATLLAQTNFTVPKNMVLITVMADAIPPDSLAEFSNSLCRDVWPKTRAALVGSQIILLIGSDEEEVLSPASLALFDQRLAAYHCTAGISQVFHSFDRYLRNYFHRTFCAAIVAARRTGLRYSRYEEAALYHLSCDNTNVAALTPFKDAFVDPNLMRLVDYDATHNTDYLTTLRYYWLYNRNSNAICRLLHIQRSTLFYRLTKIRELLNQDFNDYQSLLQLSVGIAILEVRGVIPALLASEPPPAPGKNSTELE